MAKQPYIPFYIGDYIRDTRILPLNVRGAWVEIILQSWDTNGIIIGTLEDFARIFSCDIKEANLVMQTLKQKKIFDYTELSTDEMKITVRKIVKLREISEKRKKAGFLGGNPKLKKKKDKQKDKQKHEYENENENEIVIKTELAVKGVQGENDIFERKKNFYEKVGLTYSDKYEKEMLIKFCDYWTEHNENGKKMRFEMQEVFNIARRLSTWKSNQKQFSQNGNTNSNRPKSPGELLEETIRLAKSRRTNDADTSDSEYGKAK